ncbi:MAG TPA: glycosyltransferase, partial [Polyangia bacterium]
MIVHVLGSMAAGGNERLCLEVIRRAPADQPQALVTIDPSPEGPLSELFRAIPNLQFYHQPYSRDARARFVVRLACLLRELSPRGVISYPFGLHLLISLASKAVPGCRFITHVGNPPAIDGPRRELFRNIVRASWWLNTPLYFCSKTVGDQFHALGARIPRHSRAVPNGINIDALRGAAARGRAARTKRGPIVGMVARLDAIKDHDTLLAAFSMVRQHHDGAELWIVGDGDRRPVLEQQTRERGLSASVSFLGVRHDVAEILGQLDLFVFSTTVNEGFGIALAEAMAVGLPIVATDVPACREVLDGGSCGALVPPRDSLSLSAAISAL